MSEQVEYFFKVECNCPGTHEAGFGVQDGDNMPDYKKMTCPFCGVKVKVKKIFKSVVKHFMKAEKREEIPIVN